MDSVDVISYINDILNTNLSSEEKLDRIQNEINNYFDELIEGDEQ